MEQYFLDNVDRYHKLVAGYTPPPVAKAADVAPNAAMVVTSRIRPLLPGEAGGLPHALFPRKEPAGVVDVHELRQPVRGPALLKSSHFQVDRLYDSTTETEDIYADVVRPLIPWSWNGGVGTLFAYGQTGSGKTYTISRLEQLVAEEMMGGSLEGERNVYVTIIELAGNAGHDLLNSRRPVSILEDAFGIMQLTGAIEHQITSAEDMLGLIETATAFRRTESTIKNDESSRSHAICRIRVNDPSAPGSEDGVLYLIDLAGSEAARDSAAHDAQRMRETREINKSLSVLKDCIRGKAEADALAGMAAATKRRPHVPFRQSSLTKVLKHVFDPAAPRQCRTVVVACVNPCLADVGPSKNTLRYAETLRILVPKVQPVKFDEKVPTTWTNDRLRGWIAENSGSPPVDAAILAPTESGIQILRLPPPEFEARCLRTAGVTPEQAKAFRSKLWQLHIDSQRVPGLAKKATAKADTNGALDLTDFLQRSSSKEPDPNVASVPFKLRVRPGMVVAWTPSPDSRFKLPGLNLALVLCPVSATGKDVVDLFGQPVNPQPSEPASAESSDTELGRATPPESKRFLCAMITPAILPDAYEVNIWRQIVVDQDRMDAEMVLEYDVATRYYYLAI